jgi:hypothetical protein
LEKFGRKWCPLLEEKVALWTTRGKDHKAFYLVEETDRLELWQ